MRHEDTILMLDLVDSGVIMLDSNQNIVFWNQFISQTSHIEFNQAKEKYWLDIFPTLSNTRIAKAVDKAINLNFPSILSYKLLKHCFPLYRTSLSTKPPYLLIQSIVIKPIIEDRCNKGCIIYISDVSAACKREKDLNEQSIKLRNTIKSYKEVKGQF